MRNNLANEKGEPMKRVLFISIALWISMVCGTATAYDGEHGDKKMVIGGYLSNGFAMVAGKGYEQWSNLERNDRTAKFAIGGDVYFDYYFTPLFGIDVGFGFLTKGIRFKFDNATDIDPIVRIKNSLVYMEIPVCFKIDFHHFQGTVGFAMFIALSGKTSYKDRDDNKVENKWNKGDEWQYVHRVNFGPKLAFSYAIPVGPVFIVPGISWSIHLINDLNNDELHRDNEIPDDEKVKARANNLMFNVGAEWGF